MRNSSVQKYSVPVCLLVTSLSVTPVLASWYTDQSGQEGYYKPKEYHNDKFGNFPPADIDKKLFGHLTTNKETVKNKAPSGSTTVSTESNPVLAANSSQAQNPAQQYSQQPAYSNRDRNYPQYRNQPYNRSAGNRRSGNQSTGFSPWGNNSSFNGPWNNSGGNRGMNFGGPWNNNGSSFGGPRNNSRNNRGSGFSGPWDNNGSSFSMPWGGNRGNNGSSFNPMGNGGGWGW